MTMGDFEISSSHRTLNPDEERALEDARILLSDELGTSLDDITDDDVVKAYREHGFADWSPEMAGRVVRALARKGLEHI